MIKINRIHKLMIGAIICAILFIFTFNHLVNNLTSEMVKEKGKYEKYIGEEIIINEDTLIITNYSIIEETFTLSNNQKVNCKLVINE